MKPGGPKLKTTKDEYVHVRVSAELKKKLIDFKIDISQEVRDALMWAVDKIERKRRSK